MSRIFTENFDFPDCSEAFLLFLWWNYIKTKTTKVWNKKCSLIEIPSHETKFSLKKENTDKKNLKSWTNYTSILKYHYWIISLKELKIRANQKEKEKISLPVDRMGKPVAATLQ